MTQKRVWEVNALCRDGRELRLSVLAQGNETAREAFNRDCAGLNWKFVCAEEITSEYWEAIRLEREREQALLKSLVA